MQFRLMHAQQLAPFEPSHLVFFNVRLQPSAVEGVASQKVKATRLGTRCWDFLVT
jgi:hypothetical protein